MDEMRQEQRELTDVEKDQLKTIKGMGQAFWDYLDSLGDSRELSLAKTQLELVVMWAVKSISGRS